MLDALLKAVYADNNGYTVWLCFDNDTPPPTLDDNKKLTELTKAFLNGESVKPDGSTPNTCVSQHRKVGETHRVVTKK